MSPIATPASSKNPSLDLDRPQIRLDDGLNEDEGEGSGLGGSAGPRSGLGGTSSNTGLGSLADLATLMRTIDFAARKHRNQRRKDFDETPYINHPVAVANCLAAHGVTDVRTLQAAVLHDTVEDTDTTLDELQREFGDVVTRIVQECTDPPGVSSSARKALQTKTAKGKSKAAQQVKLGDKWHNLSSIRECPPVGWTAERCQKYFVWAKTVTDACLPALPSMAPTLDALYTAHFIHNGRTYPCHPELGAPTAGKDEERWLREARRADGLRKTSSPRSSIFF